jgi:hypothetical protein
MEYHGAAFFILSACQECMRKTLMIAAQEKAKEA